MLERWNSGMTGISPAGRLSEIGFVLHNEPPDATRTSPNWLCLYDRPGPPGFSCLALETPNLKLLPQIGFVFRQPWLTHFSHNLIPGRQLPSIYLPPELALFRTKAQGSGAGCQVSGCGLPPPEPRSLPNWVCFAQLAPGKAGGRRSQAGRSRRNSVLNPQSTIRNLTALGPKPSPAMNSGLSLRSRCLWGEVLVARR